MVDAFRSGERSPTEELEASITAIEASNLNAFAFLDIDAAREKAKAADVLAPFGGVPLAIKELDSVQGWPCTEASLVYRDRVAEYTGTEIVRLVEGGFVPIGQTTASEFGGLNIGVTKLHGVTSNAWDRTRTPGGSSAGSAAAVAGGLVTIATGGDGGGSIRIPAAFNGLLGMKGTAGRIPRGPNCIISPLTVVLGCLARSVRDVARWYDVAAGYDMHDPYSLPTIEGWERDLGSHLEELRGKRLAILPDLSGSAIVRPEVVDMVRGAAEQLAADAGLELVDMEISLPEMSVEWALGNLAGLVGELGDLWPDCKDDLTTEIAFGVEMARQFYSVDMAGRAELKRVECNEAVAGLFDEVDFLICATNPDVAFPAEVTTNTMVGAQSVGVENNLALTGPFNIVGNPSCSVPIGTLPYWTEPGEQTGTELPVGMQIVGRHHADALLLDLALTVERERPWPLVAPGTT